MQTKGAVARGVPGWAWPILARRFPCTRRDAARRQPRGDAESKEPTLSADKRQEESGVRALHAP